MKIDETTVNNLAALCRLEFTGEQKIKIQKDLENILDMCEQLNSVNTDGIEPLIYMNADTNVVREDKIGESLSHVEALKNAPKKDSDFFRVPKVIEQK